MSFCFRYPVTKLGGGDSVDFLKSIGKIVAIVEATAIGNFGNRFFRLF